MNYEADHIELTWNDNVKITEERRDLIQTAVHPTNEPLNEPIQQPSFATEQFFRTIFNHAAIGMAIVGSDGSIKRANSTFQNIVGYHEVELQQMTFPEFTHPDDVDKDVKQYEQLLAGHIDDYEMEKRYINKDGCIKWVHLSVSLMTDQLTNQVLAIAIVNDIDQRKRTEIELEISNYRLTKAFKGAKEANWHWLDVNGEDQWWSPGFYQILGYKESDLIPSLSVFCDLLHPADLVKVKKAISVHLRGMGSFDIEYRLKTKSGKYKWIRAKGMVERDDARRPTEMLGIITDIDDIKNAEKILEMRNDDLENSNKELESFAYVASHDLQEPLRTVNSFLGLFRETVETTINPEAQVYLDVADKAALRMRGLLQDLLEYSRVGTQKMEYTVIESSDLLNEVISDLSAVFNESKGKIEVSATHQIYGDRNKMYRLFSNLISNSLKFRDPANLPFIKINSEEAQDKIIFSVVDNGIGIDEGQYETVFKIFKRLHTREEYQGSGIGLSVCKKIIELHHGKIFIEASKGPGTSIIIELPKHEASEN